MDTQQVETSAAFVNALENIFVAIRERGVQWSADDRARAERWQRVGVSLPRVVTVIERRAKAWRFVHGDAAGLPIGLRFYETAVFSSTMGPLLGAGGASPASPLDSPFDSPFNATVDSANDSAEETLADRLYRLLDKVPDLIGGNDDPAVQQAYRRAGMSLGRSLQGKPKDCADGIDEAAFEGAIERARKSVRKTMLDGIGTSAGDDLMANIGAALAAASLSARAAKKRRVVLVERELNAQFGVHFPFANGWRAP